MPAPGHLPARSLSVRLRGALDQVPALVFVLRGPDLVVEFANARRSVLTGDAEIIGRPLRDVLGPFADRPEFVRYGRQLRSVLETGEPVHGLEAAARLPGADAPSYWDYAIIPLGSPGAQPDGVALHAVEVTRLVEARARAIEAEHRFTTLFDANVLGVSISDAEIIFEANDAFLEMIGRTRADLTAGLSWRAMTAPESLAADHRALEQIRRDGAAPPYEKAYLRPDGSRVPVLLSASRLQSDPLRVLATSFDLSERHAVEREVALLLERERDARFAAELAGARTSRLQEVTAGLSASNSPEEIARAVVHHALEALSASAGVLVRGDLEVARAVGFPPAAVDEWRQFPALLPGGLSRAIGTGEPVLAADPAAVAATSPQLGTGWGAVAAVPVEIGGRMLGALLLAFREPRELEEPDRAFLVSLARQAAAALERGELYENRAFVAGKLQEGLLPVRLATVPGAESAVVYESISGRGEVGGDFYDLFDTGRDSWAFAVGDVSGKGTAAAVVTGLARHTLRAVARLFDDPDQILGFLNGALLRHDGPRAFCTVACAVVRAMPGGGFAVRLSSGGHPYPIVLRASGATEQIEVSGTMLGVAEAPQLDVAELALAPGDALILYTDGVLDARAAGAERFGEERLLEAVRGAAGGSAEAIAGAVEAAVRAHHPGTAADDRAIVVFRADER
ncbi:MAG: hypothetical protein QOE86_976 [Solirubrobacteraceae bacterium]|nr:hypothetical protein [Solirubrobacteraceae bacterium]